MPFYGSILYREVFLEGSGSLGGPQGRPGGGAKGIYKIPPHDIVAGLTLGIYFIKRGGTEKPPLRGRVLSIRLVVPQTATGLQGQQPLVKQDKVGKGSRLNG